MNQDRELEKNEGFEREAVVLDAEPDVAAAGAEDRPDDHRLRRPRNGGGGGGVEEEEEGFGGWG